MRTLVSRGTAAALAAGAVLAATPFAAQAVTTPGQPVENDYGQSAAEVQAEIAAAVAATPAVVTAKARVAAAHALVVSRAAAESTARKAWKRAVKHHKRSAVVKKRKRAWVAAHRRTQAARAAEATARAALNALVARTTAAVRARHYTPVDGTWTGDVAQYFIPENGLEPIQVRITVYGGHVSNVEVPVYVSTGDSGAYNAMALPQLMQSAMAAHDTSHVATVTGASLTSEAFRTSLQSALTKAGYPG